MGKVIGFAMDEIERNPAWIPALTRGGYEYKVRVTAPRGFRAGHDVCIETWIASIPSVENVLTEIFNKHKKKMDVNFHGISEPTLKDEPCMTLDQRLEKWEHMIRYKIESFYRVNPAWARR
jgi:hypothetical protein